MFALVPLLMLASAAAAMLAGRNRDDLDDNREDYLGYLAALRESVATTATAQRSFLVWAHPNPEVLWTLAGSDRMWQRRPDDTDFGRARVGIGPVALATR